MMIRSIRKSDYWGVDQLLLQLHQMDVSNRPDMFAPITRYMTRDSFNSLVENPNVIALLAREKGTAVGCCFVSMLRRSGMTPMKSAYIDLLVVDEKHRHRGIGRALFQEVQRQAKEVGAERIDLTVWSYNDIAIHAYRSYGMAPQRYVFEISV